MIKKYLTLLTLLISSANVDAQVASWIVPAKYSYIAFDKEASVFRGQSSDSTYLWNAKGECILATDQGLPMFRDKMSVLIKSDTGELLALVNTNGKLVPMPAMYSDATRQKYIVNKNCPYFCDGYLLVQKENEGYCYLDKLGREASPAFYKAKPFCNGVASVVAYKNPDQKKGEMVQAIDSKFNVKVFTVKGKVVKPGDIRFVSSKNDEGKMIVAIGKELYVATGDAVELTRLSVTENSSNKNDFVNTDVPLESAVYDHDTAFEVITKRGKLRFNEIGQLVSMAFSNGTTYQVKAAEKYDRKLDQYLEATYDEVNEVYGLNLSAPRKDMSPVVLPPQFHAVSEIVAMNAVVRQGDDYGVISVDPNKQITLQLNDDEPIAFLHRKYATELKVSLPVQVSANDVEEVVCDSKSCEIVVNTRTQNDTRQGNLLTYQCNLFVPEKLTEQQVDTKYTFYVNYQGLKSRPYEVVAKTRYKALYNANVTSKTLMPGDTVYVEFQIEKTMEDPTDYVLDASVAPNGGQMSANVTRISDNRFGAKLYDLQEGTTPIIIYIKENGCPAIPCRYNVTYKKGKGKKKGEVNVIQSE